MFLGNFNMAMHIGYFVLLLVVAVVSADRCPRGDGWVLRGDNCYRYFLNRGSWGEALSECRRQGRGATLPFINSQEKNTEVYEAAAESAGGKTNLRNFWIGLVQRDGRWTGPDNDGTLGSFSAWAEGEPNDGGFLQSEDHVEMKADNGQWNDEDGDEDAFVCEIPAEAECVCTLGCPAPEPCPTCPDCPPIFCPEPEPIACHDCPIPLPCPACECHLVGCPLYQCPPIPICACEDIWCPPPQITCPEMWTEFQGSCYLFSGKKVTLKAAKDKCKSYDASLVEVNIGEHGNAEFVGDYISTIVGGKFYIWTDINDKETEGVYVQGNEMFLGEVNAAKQKKDCVIYKTDNFKSEKCSKKHRFVCVKELPLILS